MRDRAPPLAKSSLASKHASWRSQSHPWPHGMALRVGRGTRARFGLCLRRGKSACARKVSSGDTPSASPQRRRHRSPNASPKAFNIKILGLKGGGVDAGLLDVDAQQAGGVARDSGQDALGLGEDVGG